MPVVTCNEIFLHENKIVEYLPLEIAIPSIKDGYQNGYKLSYLNGSHFN